MDDKVETARTWHGAERMLRSFSVISPEQERLLAEESAYHPSLHKKKFPASNVPADILGQIAERADSALLHTTGPVTTEANRIEPSFLSSKKPSNGDNVFDLDQSKLATQASITSSPVSGWSPTPSPKKQKVGGQSNLPPDSSAPKTPSPKFGSNQPHGLRVASKLGETSVPGLPPSSDVDSESDGTTSEEEGPERPGQGTDLNSDSSDGDFEQSENDLETSIPHAMGDPRKRRRQRNSVTLSKAQPPLLPPSLDQANINGNPTSSSVTVAQDPTSPPLTTSLMHVSPQVEQADRASHRNSLQSSPIAIRQSHDRSRKPVEVDSEPLIPTQVTSPFASSKSDPLVPSTYQPRSARIPDPRLTQSFGGDYQALPPPGSMQASSGHASSSNPTQSSSKPSRSSVTQLATMETPKIHACNSTVLVRDDNVLGKRVASENSSLQEHSQEPKRHESSYTSSHNPSLDISDLKSRFLNDLYEERGLYALFREAYPRYTVSEEKFHKICSSVLNPAKQTLLDGLFDDFIVKYSSMYEPYLLDSLLKNKKPESYIDFYKEQAGPVIANQFVINRKTLSIHLQNTNQEGPTPSSPTIRTDALATQGTRGVGQKIRDVLMEEVSQGPAEKEDPIEVEKPAEVDGVAVKETLGEERPASESPLPFRRLRRAPARPSPAYAEYAARFTALKSNRPQDDRLEFNWRL